MPCVMVKRKRTTKRRRKNVSRVMTILDSEAFPTIVDTIVRHAPWSVLCAFRPTSKHFLNLADSILCEHLVLECSNRLHPLTLTTPYGPIPRLRLKRFRWKWAPPTYHHVKEFVAAKPEVTHRSLAQTRTLDVVGSGRYDYRTVLLGKAMANLKVLRLRKSDQGRYEWCFQATPETVVLFTDVGLRKQPSPYLREDRAGRVTLQQCVEKLVCNIKYHYIDGEEQHPVCLGPGSGGHLKETVLIFTSWRPRVRRPAPSSKPTEREAGYIIADKQRWDGLVLHLAHLIANAHRGSWYLKLTLVDFHMVDPRFMGFTHNDRAAMKRDLLSSVFDNLELGRMSSGGREVRVDERWRYSASTSDTPNTPDTPDTPDTPADSAARVAHFSPWPGEECQEAIENIEFLTAADYKSRVGAEEFKLETVEHLGLADG